tara:strand:+ start:86 stop:1021 length:936 start_codon:yes stop_codon:yes gene_type:complete
MYFIILLIIFANLIDICYSYSKNIINIKSNDGLMIKTVYRIPKKPKKPPLVFIHGSNAGNWIFKENWLKFFSKNGWPSYAISMRGSFESGTLDGKKTVNFQEHYSDLKDVINYFNSTIEKPIVIAHSYGGLVLTKVLEDLKYRNLIRGAVWVSSLPPSGERFLLVRILFRLNIFKIIPAVLKGNLDDKIYRDKFIFYNKCTNDKDIKRFNNLFDLDSKIKLNLSSINSDLPNNTKFKNENLWTDSRKLVIGSYDDFILDRFSVRETANLINTKNIEFLRNSGHNMMLDSCWRNVAYKILNYIEEWRLIKFE